MVAKATRKIAGSIVYRATQDPRTASFGLFATDPTYQGCPLGTRLVKVVEGLALQERKTCLQIEVMGFATALQTYYENLNYQKPGESVAFFRVSEAKLQPRDADPTQACYLAMEKRLQIPVKQRA